MSLSHRMRAGLLVLLVGIVYANATGGTFHYDDFHSLVHNPHVRDVGRIPAFFGDATLFSADLDKAMYRPLVLVSYAVNHALTGAGAKAFLVGNLIIHLGCVLLVWQVARRLGWGAEAGAWTAAALFAVHPVVSEPVNYVSSRSESLAALFVLGALLSYVMSVEGGWRWRWLSVALFAASLLTKATGMSLLLILLAYEGLMRSSRAGVADSARRLLPYGVVAVGYVALLYGAGLLPIGEGEAVRGFGAQLATQAKAVGYYLRLLAVPVHQSVDPAFATGAGTQSAVWFGGALLVSWIAVGAVAANGRGRWWLSLPLLVVLPASAVPLNVLVNEHRIYLAVAAGAVLLAGCRPHVTLPRWPALALVVVWATLTVQRNEVWASELSLWQDAVASGAQQARGRVHLGMAQRDAGDLAAAREHFQAAIVLEPGNLAARTNLANTIYEVALREGDRGGLEEAAGHYRRVLVAAPAEREALTNLGNVELARGDTTAAADAYARAAAAHPNYADAHANLAMLALDRDDYEAAARALTRVIELEPADAVSHRRLGDALALQGRYADAAAAYEEACRLAPTDPGPRYNLGSVLRELADRAAAQGRGDAAVALAGRARDAYAQVLRQAGDYRAARQRLAELETWLAASGKGR